MKKTLYLLLGLPDSGRREILMDFASECSCSILLPDAEPAHPLDAQLSNLASICSWRWENDSLIMGVEFPDDIEAIFLIADANLDPADQIEATKGFLELHGLTLGRIITVVHCGLAEANPELFSWHQGCIHFSDVVLLNRREEVSQKWMREFLDGFRQKRFPCFFEFVKKGRVDNPPHVLDPTPRRLSLFFDRGEDQFVSDEEVEDDSIDSDDPDEDPYLAKHPSGQRRKPLPDVRSILSSIPQPRPA